jgi:hypothetical protein
MHLLRNDLQINYLFQIPQAFSALKNEHVLSVFGLCALRFGFF